MVSKYGHCLNDLLFRARTCDLPIDVVTVVSNHRDHEALVDWHGIPFFHLPVTPATKASAEARLTDIVDSARADLAVLARYMQVLSDDLCTRLTSRALLGAVVGSGVAAGWPHIEQAPVQVARRAWSSLRTA